MTFQLVWKANHPLRPGHFIAAGAGPLADGSFSNFTISLGPSLHVISDTAQMTLAGSDGTTWQSSAADGHRLPFLSLGEVPNGAMTLMANADLWTHTAGVNQDIGIELIGLDGTIRLLAWKESGGFAGTFSPNAAAVTVSVDLGPDAYQYTAQMVWKSNVRMPTGAQITMGAGPLGGAFSPTTLVADGQLTG